MSKRQLQISLDPEKTIAVLTGVVIFLLSAQLGASFFYEVIDPDLGKLLVKFFNLDREGNAPTFFAVSLWMINAVLFFVVWKSQEVGEIRFRGVWLVLSALFCFFAIDEWSSIHERSFPYFKSLFNASGIFYFAWIIPYGIGMAIISIIMIPIVWKFPRKIRFWYGLSFAAFVCGSIGLEMIEGWYLEKMNNKRDLFCNILITCEETMEMLGLVFLVYASMLLLQKACGGLSVRFSSSDIHN